MADGGKKDYKVGYAKPPEGRRFKPGQSGNSRGRPPTPKTMSGVIARLLGQNITVPVAGKRRRMPLVEALGRQAAQEAAAGDLNALMKVVKVALSLDSAASAEPTEEELKSLKKWRDFEVVSFADWLELRGLLIASGALAMDAFNRPVMTDLALDRLFEPGFDPVERERLIEEYRRSVSLRRESDLVDWTTVVEEGHAGAGGAQGKKS
jgi:uncharacterized protein DUF5681